MSLCILRPSHHLTETQVRAIRRMIDEGVTQWRIGQEFGIPASRVSEIKRGVKYAWVV